MSEPIALRLDGPVAVVTLHRTHAENKLDAEMFASLRKTALKLSDAPPRVVLIGASGPDFSCGLDLGVDNPLIGRIEPLMKNRDAYRTRELVQELRKCLDGFARIPCPVIAALEGRCLGAGLELALVADLRVAGEGVTLGLPEVSYGMIPDLGGVVRLSRLVGHARASDLVLAGRTLDAATAERWGLVNHVTGAGGAMDHARELADRLVRTSPNALRQATLALRGVDSLSASDAFEIEAECGARAIISGDLEEGLLAHLQGREPSWS